MTNDVGNEITYSIFDPTGNITALVESFVPIDEQAAVAARLMEELPAVEQVGFTAFPGDGFSYGQDSATAKCGCLRMAGGEFCGNAAMSAAALYLIRHPEAYDGTKKWQHVSLSVSGAAEDVEVRLQKQGEDFLAEVHMPSPLAISETAVSWHGKRDLLQLVKLQGISHILIPDTSALYTLLEEPAAAEACIRAVCAALALEGLGFLFLSGAAPELQMTPLVYVPGSGTVFWEHACASGTAAVGLACARKKRGDVNLQIRQPGGVLTTRCDVTGRASFLCGSTGIR